jgi:uncharacterized protein (DUF885 family)
MNSIFLFHPAGRLALSLLASATLLVLATLLTAPASAQTERLNPRFEALIDRYLAEVRGIGGSESRDMSAESFARDLGKRRAILQALRDIDRDTLSFDQDIDYRFLESILVSTIAEAEQVQRWKQNPREYLEIGSLNYLLDADPRMPEIRAADMVKELRLLQKRMANGEKNLVEYIPRWVELSRPMLDGIQVILETQVPAFAERAPAQQSALLAENRKTIAAAESFRTFMNEDLPQQPEGDWRIGADLFNTLLESRQMFTQTMDMRRIARAQDGFMRVPDYHDWGWRQFGIVEKQLEVQARKIDPTRSWLEIIKDTKQDHPSAENLVFAHLEATRKSREWVIEQDLVTIPWDDDDAIMVAAAPNQWMTQWWGWGPGVPAGSDSRKAAWTVIPVNPDWPLDVQEANLTEKDYSFMYAIATHEVYPGHHLQRLYQNASHRKLRIYESSYSNQAWCYYIEWELTPNYGFYPPEKQDLYTLEMLRLKLWRMGRVIIDSGLHTGRMSYDEALELETDRIGFVRQGGQINIDTITEIGGYMSPATLGYFEWMLLREDYFKKMRELDQKGELKDFHDRIYKIGFLPVALVRESLMHELEQEFRP